MHTVPAHDHHHRHAMHADWANLIFDRQRAIDAGEAEYTDVWGLVAAINIVLEGLAPAASRPGPRAAAVRSSSVLMSM